jgi:hypothetical protein
MSSRSSFLTEVSFIAGQFAGPERKFHALRRIDSYKHATESHAAKLAQKQLTGCGVSK